MVVVPNVFLSPTQNLCSILIFTVGYMKFLQLENLGETAISPSGALFEAWGDEVHFGDLITLEFQNILVGSTFFCVNDKGSGCFMRNKYTIHIKPIYLYLTN